MHQNFYNIMGVRNYRRWIYLAVTFVIVLARLASRRYGDMLLGFMADYSGDTLWAAMVYLEYVFFPLRHLSLELPQSLYSFLIA